jgi:hypothetical protein
MDKVICSREFQVHFVISCLICRPYTDAMIEKLGKDGVKSLIVVPVRGCTTAH